MTQIDVLPTELAAAARAVRAAAREVQPLATPELGHHGLTAALDELLGTRSPVALRATAEDAARALEEAAAGYRGVESLLLPRGLR